MVESQFKIKDTTATHKIFALKKRIRAVAGGTGASKTISILIWCIDYAQSTKHKLVTVVSESFPHLEDGAIRDFEMIMKDRGYWRDDKWHGTKHEYTFEGGTVIEFVSVDTYGKAHGPRRDVLFINECNNLPYPIARQLFLRTRDIIWLDWNPSSDFWYYSEIEGKRDDIDFITLTYLDNEALDAGERAEIEALRTNKYLWRVYGEGLLGQLEGMIYPNWQILDEIPHTGYLEVRGLDFGYTNDPTALVDIYKKEGGFVWDETIFQKGLSNKQIADVIKNLQKPETLIIADSAEPKSIDELKSYGLNIIPAEKGPDSVINGIQMVQSRPHWITKRSTNIIKENRNYLFMTDKDGKIINKPEHAYSHSMDAGRYGEVGILKKPKFTMVAASPIAQPYYGDREVGI